jgi:D-serine deaminase-like pyridoxal phosphate-dependent protein
MMDLDRLPTPALLLDELRMERNVQRMRRTLARHQVTFRPHVKTSKSLQVAARLTASAFGPITVSTLAEAEFFGNHGYRDVLYAVGLSADKLERVAALRASGINVTVILDNAATARAVAKRSKQAGDAIPTLIEVDCDGRRAGVAPEDEQSLLEIGRMLAGGAHLEGVVTHAGGSYGSVGADHIGAWAARERDAVVRAAHVLRAEGIACETVSVGSTPTALFARDLTGVTEVRAGVFVFFDLVMAGIGVCSPSDVALSVLTTVIGTHTASGRLIVDAGWMALSRDRGTANQMLDCGYGLVCDASGQPIENLLMVDANQEHGVLEMRAGTETRMPPLTVGDRVRILPNHACATAAQHDEYIVVRGESPRVVDRWQRLRGW